MKFRMYKAKFTTGDKTVEEIKENFSGPISNKEAAEWKEVFELISGAEVIVTNSFTRERYSIIGWPEESEEKIKELIYLAEQDMYFGTYQNEREQFMKDWAAGTYEPAGSLALDEEDIEVIKELN